MKESYYEGCATEDRWRIDTGSAQGVTFAQ